MTGSSYHQLFLKKVFRVKSGSTALDELLSMDEMTANRIRQASYGLAVEGGFESEAITGKSSDLNVYPFVVIDLRVL